MTNHRQQADIVTWLKQWKMGAMRLHDQTKEAKQQDNPSKRDKYGLIVFETTRQISNRAYFKKHKSTKSTHGLYIIDDYTDYT